jgi:hypothetical protein
MQAVAPGGSAGVSAAAVGDDGRFRNTQFRGDLTSGHACLNPRRDLQLTDGHTRVTGFQACLHLLDRRFLGA